MSEITYMQAVRDAISEEMRRDEDVFLMGEDIGIYGGCFGLSKGMLREFGEDRIMDTPLSEAGITGAAVGAAMMGMRPIVEIMFADFLTVCMDQIANQAAKTLYMYGGQCCVPMVVRTPGGCGTRAAAQHSQSVEGWITNVPGLRIVAPSTPYDAKGLMKASTRDNNPVFYIEEKVLYTSTGEVPDDDYTVAIGEADIKREGTDVTILTYGRTVSVCLGAAEQLSHAGADVEVVDIRTLAPLDTETVIQSAKKTGRVLIVHEACQTGGFGGELAAVVAGSEAFYTLRAPVKRLCGADVPIISNKTLEASIVPSVDTVKAAVTELLG